MQSKPYLPAIHLMSFYRERFGHRRGEFPVCEDVADRSLALPFFPAMTEGQVAASPRRSPLSYSHSARRVKHDDATLVDIDRDGDLDVFTTEERLRARACPSASGHRTRPVRRRAGRGTFRRSLT